MSPRPGEPELGKLLNDAILDLQFDEDDHMSAVQQCVTALLANGRVETRWHRKRGHPMFPQTDDETEYRVFTLNLDPEASA